MLTKHRGLLIKEIRVQYLENGSFSKWQSFKVFFPKKYKTFT